MNRSTDPDPEGSTDFGERHPVHTYFGAAPGAVLSRAERVRVAVFDVDGVLTDGTIWVPPDGDSGVVFHIHDGKGLRMLLDHDIQVALLTARGGRAVARRCEDLGIEHLLQGRTDKGAALEELSARLHVPLEACAFTGDDLVDLPALQRAGLAIAVGDAHPAVSARAHWQTGRAGGRGAVREVCELILDAQGLLGSAIEAHAR